MSYLAGKISNVVGYISYYMIKWNENLHILINYNPRIVARVQMFILI